MLGKSPSPKPITQAPKTLCQNDVLKGLVEAYIGNLNNRVNGNTTHAKAIESILKSNEIKDTLKVFNLGVLELSKFGKTRSEHFHRKVKEAQLDLGSLKKLKKIIDLINAKILIGIPSLKKNQKFNANFNFTELGKIVADKIKALEPNASQNVNDFSTVTGLSEDINKILKKIAHIESNNQHLLADALMRLMLKVPENEVNEWVSYSQWYLNQPSTCMQKNLTAAITIDWLNKNLKEGELKVQFDAFKKQFGLDEEIKNDNELKIIKPENNMQSQGNPSLRSSDEKATNTANQELNAKGPERVVNGEANANNLGSSNDPVIEFKPEPGAGESTAINNVGYEPEVEVELKAEKPATASNNKEIKETKEKPKDETQEIRYKEEHPNAAAAAGYNVEGQENSSGGSKAVLKKTPGTNGEVSNSLGEGKAEQPENGYPSPKTPDEDDLLPGNGENEPGEGGSAGQSSDIFDEDDKDKKNTPGGDNKQGINSSSSDSSTESDDEGVKQKQVREKPQAEIKPIDTDCFDLTGFTFQTYLALNAIIRELPGNENNAERSNLTLAIAFANTDALDSYNNIYELDLTKDKELARSSFENMIKIINDCNDQGIIDKVQKMFNSFFATLVTSNKKVSKGKEKPTSKVANGQNATQGSLHISVANNATILPLDEELALANLRAALRQELIDNHEYSSQDVVDLNNKIDEYRKAADLAFDSFEVNDYAIAFYALFIITKGGSAQAIFDQFEIPYDVEEMKTLVRKVEEVLNKRSLEVNTQEEQQAENEPINSNNFDLTEFTFMNYLVLNRKIRDLLEEKNKAKYSGLIESLQNVNNNITLINGSNLETDPIDRNKLAKQAFDNMIGIINSCNDQGIIDEVKASLDAYFARLKNYKAGSKGKEKLDEKASLVNLRNELGEVGSKYKSNDHEKCERLSEKINEYKKKFHKDIDTVEVERYRVAILTLFLKEQGLEEDVKTLFTKHGFKYDINQMTTVVNGVKKLLQTNKSREKIINETKTTDEKIDVYSFDLTEFTHDNYEKLVKNLSKLKVSEDNKKALNTILEYINKLYKSDKGDVALSELVNNKEFLKLIFKNIIGFINLSENQGIIKPANEMLINYFEEIKDKNLRNSEGGSASLRAGNNKKPRSAGYWKSIPNHRTESNLKNLRRKIGNPLSVFLGNRYTSLTLCLLASHGLSKLGEHAAVKYYMPQFIANLNNEWLNKIIYEKTSFNPFFLGLSLPILWLIKPKFDENDNRASQSFLTLASIATILSQLPVKSNGLWQMPTFKAGLPLIIGASAVAISAIVQISDKGLGEGLKQVGKVFFGRKIDDSVPGRPSDAGSARPYCPLAAYNPVVLATMGLTVLGAACLIQQKVLPFIINEGFNLLPLGELSGNIGLLKCLAPALLGVVLLNKGISGRIIPSDQDISSLTVRKGLTILTALTCAKIYKYAGDSRPALILGGAVLLEYIGVNYTKSFSEAVKTIGNSAGLAI